MSGCLCGDGEGDQNPTKLRGVRGGLSLEAVLMLAECCCLKFTGDPKQSSWPEKVENVHFHLLVSCVDSTNIYATEALFRFEF